MKRPLSYRLVERFVFGQRGLDIRGRIFLYKGLEAAGSLSDKTPAEERKAQILHILPLEYGARFPILGPVLTILAGFAFILGARPSLEHGALGLHGVFSGKAAPLNYVVLVAQWGLFYFAASLVGAFSAAAIALLAYGMRLLPARAPGHAA